MQSMEYNFPRRPLSGNSVNKYLTSRTVVKIAETLLLLSLVGKLPSKDLPLKFF